MKVHFLASEGDLLASARFRAWDIVKAWNDSEVTCSAFQPDFTVEQGSIVVIAKLKTTRDTISALDTILRCEAIPVWDLCDPVWYWWPDLLFKQVASAMGAIVVSSQGLKDGLKREFGLSAILIEDRLQPVEESVHKPTDIPTMVWYGYYGNRKPVIHTVMPVLKRLVMNQIPYYLHILDNAPTIPEFIGKGSEGFIGLKEITRYSQWRPETFPKHLRDADIALLPPMPGVLGHYKSDNKLATASWYGLPTTTGLDYTEVLRLLTDYDYRIETGKKARAIAEQRWNVKTSVEEWKTLVTKLIVNRRAEWAKVMGANCDKLSHKLVLEQLVKENNWTNGVEVGVFKGRTFFHLLKNCPNLHLTGVDLFAPKPEQDKLYHLGGRSYENDHLPEAEKQIRHRVLTEFPTRGNIIRGDSAKSAELFEDHSFDFVFIDADHLESGVRADIAAWKRKVKPGGTLLGHDLFMPGVKAAVTDLCPGYTEYLQEIWGIEV